MKKGDLLFEIDPATFQACGGQRRRPTPAGPRRLRSRPPHQNLQRQTEALRNESRIDIQTFQIRRDDTMEADAIVVAAEATLETARLNLETTRRSLPRWTDTDERQYQRGNYVNAGEQLAGLVDGSSCWFAAYFKETQLQASSGGHQGAPDHDGARDPALSGSGQIASPGVSFYRRFNGRSPASGQPDDRLGAAAEHPVSGMDRRSGATPVPLRIGQTIRSR